MKKRNKAAKRARKRKRGPKIEAMEDRSMRTWRYKTTEEVRACRTEATICAYELFWLLTGLRCMPQDALSIEGQAQDKGILVRRVNLCNKHGGCRVLVVAVPELDLLLRSHKEITLEYVVAWTIEGRAKGWGKLPPPWEINRREHRQCF